MKVPCPVMRFSLNSPSQSNRFGCMQCPLPSFVLSLYSPSQDQPFLQTYFPFPFFLSSFHSPSQQNYPFPSQQIPFPSLWFMFQLPTQIYPFVPSHIPNLSFCPFVKWPSQYSLTFVCMISPKPSLLFSFHCPTQTCSVHWKFPRLDLRLLVQCPQYLVQDQVIVPYPYLFLSQSTSPSQWSPYSQSIIVFLFYSTVSMLSRKLKDKTLWRIVLRVSQFWATSSICYLNLFIDSSNYGQGNSALKILLRDLMWIILPIYFSFFLGDVQLGNPKNIQRLSQFLKKMLSNQILLWTIPFFQRQLTALTILQKTMSLSHLWNLSFLNASKRWGQQGALRRTCPSLVQTQCCSSGARQANRSLEYSLTIGATVFMYLASPFRYFSINCSLVRFYWISLRLELESRAYFRMLQFAYRGVKMNSCLWLVLVRTVSLSLSIGFSVCQQPYCSLLGVEDRQPIQLSLLKSKIIPEQTQIPSLNQCNKPLYNFPIKGMLLFVLNVIINNFSVRMATTTIAYQQLQTQNLITFSFESIASNFKTIDAFMRSFSTFQRKFNDMEKMQKATSLDLNNFKMSTSNHFATLNQVLESRGSISKGSTKGLEEDLAEAKKLIKELKLFVTESTRDLNATLQSKEKETQQAYKKYDAKFGELYTFRQNDRLRIESLEQEIFNVKAKYTTKAQSDRLKESLQEANVEIEKVRESIAEVSSLLSNLGVKQFKEHLDTIESELNSDMQEMKVKLKLKTDLSDTLKLQEMMLNIITYSYDHLNKKTANKNQTKKALIFLQKKINSLLQTLFAEEEGERDGLIAAKTWKCISCTKDLGEYEGKLDKYKAWSVFPAKDQGSKDKYSGFGTGFQNIIETVVSKKGGEISYDQKGRMTTPFNLTRQVQQGSTGLKHTPSQGKLSKNSSPLKQPTQSNYMNLFGRNSELDIDIRGEYLQQQKGLMSAYKSADLKQK